MPRAVLYHRVSTSDQDPATAREELRGAARARGLDVVMDIEETGSGARNDRVGLQRVMHAARTGKVDCVIVWKLDRFGRSVLDLLSNVRELTACAVRFVAVTQGLDVHAAADPTSMLILRVLAAVAEFELDLIRERTRAGMDKARREGTKTGRPIGRQPVSVDERRARTLLKEGASYAVAAAELGVSRSYLRQHFPGWQKRDLRGLGGKPREPAAGGAFDPVVLKDP